MTDRQVFICYSDDGGHTWSNWRILSLGAQGEYGKRVQLNRVGRFRNRIFKVRVSSPIKRDLLGAVAHVQVTSG
jgi:hypothetical protein